MTPPPKSIDGRARTVRELLDKAKYDIDFYQREYAWKERQVRELLDDLTGKFLDSYEPSHAREEVEGYGHYFLGSIVISLKRKKRFVVDGQQRLTTLTLLLIHLHRLQKDRDERVDVQNLIYSEKYGRKSFNLDVPDRVEVMRKLMDGERIEANGGSESVRNIAARYENIANYLPRPRATQGADEEVTGTALPYFVDWLLENVHLVEIEALSDEDAYTIFETMNDRGLSLSLPEMLKGYVLANVRREDDQKKLNRTWKEHMRHLKELGDGEEVDFFKNWLRARHAKTIRPGRKGAENQDYERIGSEFHRWVRDQRKRLGLAEPSAFVRFVSRDLDFYARRSIDIRVAARDLKFARDQKPGWESVHYNEDRGFTLQTQVLLASLAPDDDAGEIRRKVALVADFLDIWLARRVWNFRTVSYSSVRHALFNLTKELRGRDARSLSEFLRGKLAEQPERFHDQPHFRLHGQNRRHVKHILARLTHWVDTQCGRSSSFRDLTSRGRARPFEIEHMWANHYHRFTDWFAHRSEFEIERNRLGGLLLLQRGVNQSLGDAEYEEKRDAYLAHGQNLLARSLHPLAYENDPAFQRFLDWTGLPFRPYESFGPKQLAERQELYIKIAQWVWNPSRLDLDGEKPPTVEGAKPPGGGTRGPHNPIPTKPDERDGAGRQLPPTSPTPVRQSGDGGAEDMMGRGVPKGRASARRDGTRRTGETGRQPDPEKERVMTTQYWLIVADPSVYSIDNLERDERTEWDRVGNHEARKNMRAMRMDDEVLFYHSRAKPPGVAGLARVCREAYPDHVDVEFVEKFPELVPLKEIKMVPKLDGMVLVSRPYLSVQSVTKEEFGIVCAMARKPPAWASAP